MVKITDIVMRMQNELRNKEGITGIDAMHHINMVLLSKSFNKEMCEKLGIPESLSFDELSKLPQNELMKAFYTQIPIATTLLYHIRLHKRFGYNKDIAFQITNESTLKYLFTQVVEIPTEELFETVDVIGDIYEHFINREGQTMKDVGQYFTNRLLIKYIVNMVNPTLNENGLCKRVWDPAAGTGGFLIEYISHLNKKTHVPIDWSINKHNIYGNDISKNTTALLKQNLYYSFREDCGSVDMRDSLVINSDIKYDYILANPPFGVKGLLYTDMNTDIKALEINGTKGEILFLQLCMTRLNENGKCAIIVPDAVLTNDTKMYSETRKYLINNFNILKIIKNNDGDFFKNTMVSTSIIYFQNNGTTTEIEYIKLCKNNDNINDTSIVRIGIDNIIKNDYILNINSYTNNIVNIPKPNYHEYYLGDLFDLVRGSIQSTKSIPGDYKLVSQSDKKTHNEYTHDGAYLFISSVKPIGTIYYYDGKFSCSTLLTILVPKVDNINIKYLYHLFKKHECIFKCCEVGSANKSLNKNIFNRMKVYLPSLDIQNNIINKKLNPIQNNINQLKNQLTSLQNNINIIIDNNIY